MHDIDASLLSSASLHEAGGKIGALPPELKPLSSEQRLFGPVFPVRCPAGDNLYLHHAIYAASPGDILVVDAGGATQFGHWGDIMTSAAQERGLAGLVIYGGVRDSQQIVSMEFPVYSTGIGIQGTDKDPEGAGSLNSTIRIGEVDIHPGDWIFGDCDGVVVLPARAAESIVRKSLDRDAQEDAILWRLKAGETTLEIYNLPTLSDTRKAPDGIRRSLMVEGLSHGGLPIPTGSRVRNVVATGGLMGIDPRTGSAPKQASEQVEQMFRNLRSVIEMGGARLEDILKVTIWVSDPSVRSEINPAWIAMFPNEASRPARHILNYDLPAGYHVQCEALAVID